MVNRTKAVLALWFVLPWALNAGQSGHMNLAEEFARLGYEQIELQRTAENHLYLAGKLNGRRRSTLVDTGWSVTTISTNAARNLPRPGELGVPLPNCAFDTNKNSAVVLIQTLQLGHTTFTSQPALVQNMAFDGQATPFEIVLGCDFLRRNFAVIDCLNRRLYAHNHALIEPEQNALEEMLRAGGFEEVPLKLKRPLAITCPARVNGQPLEMLVDTGAVWSSLDLRQLDRLGLRSLPTLAKISGVGGTGTRGVAVAEAKTFALGDVPMQDTNFALMDLGDWGLAAPNKGLAEVQGILGGSELMASSALIDCHRLKLWVKRAGAKK